MSLFADRDRHIAMFMPKFARHNVAVRTIVVFSVLRFYPVLLLRMALFLGSTKLCRPFAKLLGLYIQGFYGLEFSLASDIGSGLILPHPSGVVLGAAKIGRNCTIFQNVTLGAKFLDAIGDASSRPIIGNDVIIGAGAILVGPIRIGDGSSIGANSVVAQDVPVNGRVRAPTSVISESILRG